MPKIIENLESKLIEEAARQIEQFGYADMTIRSVAKACGVGVGTVYNYFPSKEALLATYMLDDWNACITAIGDMSRNAVSPAPVIRCIFDQLLSFADRHRAIIRSETAASVFAGTFSRYHKLLRAQLAAPVRKYCSSDFAAEFIAESLLTWSMSGRSFDEIYGMIEKLF